MTDGVILFHWSDNTNPGVPARLRQRRGDVFNVQRANKYGAFVDGKWEPTKPIQPDSHLGMLFITGIPEQMSFNTLRSRIINKRVEFYQGTPDAPRSCNFQLSVQVFLDSLSPARRQDFLDSHYEQVTWIQAKGAIRKLVVNQQDRENRDSDVLETVSDADFE